MRSLFLTVSRIVVAGWVGAASLFVVTAVQESTSQDFSSEMKSALALLRFPSYYLFGFTLILAALISGFLVGKHAAVGRRRRWLYRVLLVLVLILMIVDYLAVYQPLENMLAEAEEARPANFQSYHLASQYLNAAHVGLSFLAAVLICWPGSKRSG